MGSGTRLVPPLLILAAVVLWTWRLTLTQLGLVGLDAFTYFFPNAAYASEAIRSGRLPLWNPDIFLGVPFLANPQVGLFYPPNLLGLFLPPHRGAAWLFAGHLVVAGVGTYLFCRRALRMGRFGSLVSGLSIAGSGALGGQAQHPNQVGTLAWLPLLLLWVQGSWERRGVYPFLTAGLVALVLFAGHAQSALIVLTASLAYAAYLALGFRLNETISLRTVTPRLGIVLGSLALGVALAAIQLVPSWELARLSPRGGGLELRQALSFSLPPQHLMVSLLPAFADSPFTEFIAYIGVSGLFLAAVGIGWSRRRPTVWAAAGLAAAGLFLSMGVFNPLYVLLVETLPGLNLFRVPARWIFLFSFGLSLLAGLGAETWLEGEVRRSSIVGQRWLWAAGILAFSVVSAWILLGPKVSAASWTGWIVAAGAMLGIFAWPVRARGRWGSVALAALMVGELFVAGRYLPHAEVTAPEAYTSLRTSTTHLLADQGLFRVLSISETQFDPGDIADLQHLFDGSIPPDSIADFLVATKWKEVLAPNLAMAFGIPTADGYDGGILPTARYLQLAGLLHDEGNEPLTDGRLYQSLVRVPPTHLLDLLNVKYLILDKVRDLWIEDAYYDLGLREEVVPEESLTVPVPDSPTLLATHLGLIYGLEGGSSGEAAGVVAELLIRDRSDQVTVRRLPAPAAEAVPRELGNLDGPEGLKFYHAAVSVPESARPVEISVSTRESGISMQIAAITLIDERTGGHLPVTVSEGGRFRLVHSGDVKIYQNLKVLPRAFLAEAVQVVQDDTEALRVLSQPGFAGGRVAVTTDRLPAVNRPRGAGGWVEIVSYSPEQVELRSGAPGSRVLVLTDAFYPGWTAEVDGAAVPVHRVDFYFRGIWLGPGEHQVVLRYQPPSFRAGAAISGLALLVTTIGGVGGWLGGRRTDEVDIIRRRDG